MKLSLIVLVAVVAVASAEHPRRALSGSPSPSPSPAPKSPSPSPTPKPYMYCRAFINTFENADGTKSASLPTRECVGSAEIKKETDALAACSTKLNANTPDDCANYVPTCYVKTMCGEYTKTSACFWTYLTSTVKKAGGLKKTYIIAGCSASTNDATATTVGGVDILGGAAAGAKFRFGQWPQCNYPLDGSKDDVGSCKSKTLCGASKTKERCLNTGADAKQDWGGSVGRCGGPLCNAGSATASLQCKVFFAAGELNKDIPSPTLACPGDLAGVQAVGQMVQAGYNCAHGTSATCNVKSCSGNYKKDLQPDGSCWGYNAPCYYTIACPKGTTACFRSQLSYKKSEEVYAGCAAKESTVGGAADKVQYMDDYFGIYTASWATGNYPLASNSKICKDDTTKVDRRCAHTTDNRVGTVGRCTTNLCNSSGYAKPTILAAAFVAFVAARFM